MDFVMLLVMGIGVLLLARRLMPRRDAPQPEPSAWPLVSIVVPARNEEAVLGRLLESLSRLDYPGYDVIVVNDRSTDATGAVARRFPVTVIDGVERPQGWGGKQWACWQGAEKAKGSYVLFTDADTWHHPHSLKAAVRAALAHDAALTTALPFHACETIWEKLMGPFHVLLLSATKPFATPRRGQLFAIGQYLLFRRKDYDALGGHAAVRADIVEDVPLGMRVVQRGLALHVLNASHLYSVRMYATPREFFAGWRRNFRAGMATSAPRVTAEIVCMIAAISGGFHWSEPVGWSMMVVSALAMAVQQRRIGSFSPMGPLLWPFAITAFVGISLVAVIDRVRKRPVRWKDRSYETSRLEGVS